MKISIADFFQLATRPITGPVKPFIDKNGYDAFYYAVRYPMIGYFGGQQLDHLVQNGLKATGWLGTFIALDIPILTLFYSWFKLDRMHKHYHLTNMGFDMLEAKLMSDRQNANKRKQKNTTKAS